MTEPDGTMRFIDGARFPSHAFGQTPDEFKLSSGREDDRVQPISSINFLNIHPLLTWLMGTHESPSPAPKTPACTHSISPDSAEHPPLHPHLHPDSFCSFDPF